MKNIFGLRLNTNQHYPGSFSIGFVLLFCCSTQTLFGQNNDTMSNFEKDSIRIQIYEGGNDPVKVLHAEPLYIDLIRDLGARKGEKEWNLGLGVFDNLSFDSYEALIEYEFAPVNRLGLEIELPFTFYSPQQNVSKDSVPSNQLDGLQLAGQWSFFVSEKA